MIERNSGFADAVDPGFTRGASLRARLRASTAGPFVAFGALALSRANVRVGASDGHRQDSENRREKSNPESVSHWISRVAPNLPRWKGGVKPPKAATPKEAPTAAFMDTHGVPTVGLHPTSRMGEHQDVAVGVRHAELAAGVVERVLDRPGGDPCLVEPAACRGDVIVVKVEEDRLLLRE